MTQANWGFSYKDADWQGDVDSIGESMIMFEFDVRRNPQRDIERLAPMFPDIFFIATYYEKKKTGKAGRIHMEDGEVTERDLYDGRREPDSHRWFLTQELWLDWDEVPD